jgi:hypothetical protein
VRNHVTDHHHWGPLFFSDTSLFNFSQCM